MKGYEPFDTSLVADRIRDQVKGLRLIGNAADYAAVKDLRSFVVPSAYVIFAAESGEPSPRGARGQPASADFGVALAVRNYRTQRGAQLADELRTLLGEVRTALIGWTPPVPGVTAIGWRSGAVMDYDDSTALWVDVYECTHVLQQ